MSIVILLSILQRKSNNNNNNKKEKQEELFDRERERERERKREDVGRQARSAQVSDEDSSRDYEHHKSGRFGIVGRLHGQLELDVESAEHRGGRQRSRAHNQP